MTCQGTGRRLSAGSAWSGVRSLKKGAPDGTARFEDLPRKVAGSLPIEAPALYMVLPALGNATVRAAHAPAFGRRRAHRGSLPAILLVKARPPEPRAEVENPEATGPEGRHSRPAAALAPMPIGASESLDPFGSLGMDESMPPISLLIAVIRSMVGVINRIDFSKTRYSAFVASRIDHPMPEPGGGV